MLIGKKCEKFEGVGPLLWVYKGLVVVLRGGCDQYEES